MKSDSDEEGGRGSKLKVVENQLKHIAVSRLIPTTHLPHVKISSNSLENVDLMCAQVFLRHLGIRIYIW